MKRKTSESNLEIIERIHHAGITWLILFVVFFAMNPHSNLLFKLLDSLAMIFEMMLFVWFVNKLLFNHLMSRQKAFWFIAVSFIAIVFWSYFSAFVAAWLSSFFNTYSPKKLLDFRNLSFLAVFRFLCFMAVFIVTLVFFYQKKENRERAAAEMLETEKLDMELRYLKSQINPHFLFNALNNIYTMVYMHDDNAPNGVLKLSEMLRYVLVDCQADSIPLSKETNYIDNFIEFQMMRIENECNVRFDKDIENDAYLIAPMLLQPIVENCFKFSRLDTHPDGYVHLVLTQRNGTFRFVAENSVAQCTAVTTETQQNFGIGQKNVKQRLKLHYGERYRFETRQDENNYKVIIEL